VVWRLLKTATTHGGIMGDWHSQGWIVKIAELVKKGL